MRTFTAGIGESRTGWEHPCQSMIPIEITEIRRTMAGKLPPALHDSNSCIVGYSLESFLRLRWLSNE